MGINRIFTTTDYRGIGMLDAKDRRGHKNTYIDLLQRTAMEEHCTFSGTEAVLEYGCGAGRISTWLGSRVARVIAADPELRLLNVARAADRQENVCYVQIPYGGFPFSDASVDVVTCIGLLRLLNDEEAQSILSGIKRVLKPRGYLICIDQVSPRQRPGHRALENYVNLFETQHMGNTTMIPIRKGHWLPLYLIQLGFIPRRWFPKIARYELRNRPRQERSSRDYYQFLFHYIMG